MTGNTRGLRRPIEKASGGLARLACLLILLSAAASVRGETNGLVAVVGSSVAKGLTTGGTIVNGSYLLGYAGRLTTALTAKDWAVTNLSIPGNDTSDVLGRFDTDVLPAQPDQVLIGLSLGNEGLNTTADPAAVFESFRTGFSNILGRVRANNMYALTGLCYPHNYYDAERYGYIKSMNLLINSWDLPSVNFLGALDDGSGNWVEGYYADDAHPNALGHQELFYTIVPSLFDAIRLGKTQTPHSNLKGRRCARIARDPAVRAPLRFTPERTVHSFTTAFRVRSSDTGTVAAVVAEAPPPAAGFPSSTRLLVDFGPSNDDDGRAAPSPDANGNHWNSWRPAEGGKNFGSGVILPNLVTAADGTSTPVGLRATGTFWTNGRLNGGLLAPDPALLGDFAIAEATEDYFYNSVSSSFRITGLDPNALYTLRFFGSRDSTQTRKIGFTATGANGTFTTNLVTSGTDVGSGGYDGNNDTVAQLAGVKPDASNEISVAISIISGSYFHLSLMEIRHAEVTSLELNDRLLVDFGPSNDDDGRAAPSPDANGNHWNSWRPQEGGLSIAAGTVYTHLHTAASAKPTPVGLEVTESFSGSNGRLNGGLLAPSAALLGDFAVTNATEDYFHDTDGAAAFKIKGLDPRFTYKLRFFGTRTETATRETRFTATAGNGVFSTNLITTGTGIGDGGYNGNNDTIAELNGLTADRQGEIAVALSPVQSIYIHIGIMEIQATGLAPARAESAGRILVDFGPSNNDDGRAVVNPDGNGLHWNSWRPVAGGSSIPAGTKIIDLIRADSGVATYVGLEVIDSFNGSNGRVHGGLLAPSSGLLGAFAVPYATEDYFYDQNTAGLKISGLNPNARYTLRFFGTRQETDTRETRYTVTAGNGAFATNLITTGAGIGADGYNGNNDTIARVSGLVPTVSGELLASLSIVSGGASYLGIMEIVEDEMITGTGWGTVELRPGAVVYVASTGHEIAAQVDALSGGWHDVAVSHCYARQQTLLFVDGVEAGCIPEQLAPTAFVLGGEGAASAGRMAAPAQADYQDWCVYRSAWHAGEAQAQASGHLQQASMEICAALDDASFSPGSPVSNRAQSLSEAVINTSSMSSEHPYVGTLIRLD